VVLKKLRHWGWGVEEATIYLAVDDLVVTAAVLELDGSAASQFTPLIQLARLTHGSAQKCIGLCTLSFLDKGRYFGTSSPTFQALREVTGAERVEDWSDRDVRGCGKIDMAHETSQGGQIGLVLEVGIEAAR
jgi:hypothetical protein